VPFLDTFKELARAHLDYGELGRHEERVGHDKEKDKNEVTEQLSEHSVWVKWKELKKIYWSR
jgi:hypothetical protein